MRPLSLFSLYKALLCAVVLILIPAFASADTIYFKDGKVWTGLIQAEDEQKIDLYLGFDTARLEKEKIVGVHRSDAAESRALQKQLALIKQNSDKARRRRIGAPVTVKLYDDGNGHFFVKARLNDRYDAELVLDTGASTIVLSKALARKMALDKDPKYETAQLKVADGRTSEGRYLLLSSVEVEGARAEKVGAVFAVGRFDSGYLKDGLLGMSYLNRFGFHIDFQRKIMTLEKI